jgi:hypothetical protein
MNLSSHRRPLALLVGLCLAAGLAAGAALSIATSDASAAGPRLRAFAGCGEYLRYVKRHAQRLVGPYGLPGGIGVLDAVPVAEAAPGEEAPSAAPTPGVDYSTTNVQEEGVDEPDIVKTDGETLYAVAGGRLRVVDVTGARPRLLASVALGEGWNHQLLLAGDRLLVLSPGGGLIEPLPAAESIAPIGQLTTVLTEVDVSDPSRPRIARTMTMEGSLLAGRLTGTTARVVIAAAPAVLPFVGPASGDPVAAAQATTENRSVIASSRVLDWLPKYRIVDRRTGRKATRALVGCRSVSRPTSFPGLGMIAVVTIDLEKGLEPVDSDAVMTGGEIVYASPESLYVATQRWVDWNARAEAGEAPEGLSTEIHRFDVSDPSRTEYRSSGRVPGYLLSQWSLSEHEGRLRVASTDQPPWWGDVQLQSESFVTVLEEQGRKLVQVGRVGNLGKGERIYAVRMIGETGYVVTFRQVDPLYVVDLSDPAAPRVRGGLKIPGFSSYLHPLGDGLLLGVGRDATEDGRVLGVQVSLFDVSDPARPKRLARHDLGQGFSEAEFDHHAFLWWPATRLAVLPLDVPVAVPLPVEGEQPVTESPIVQNLAGAVGLSVGRSGITELGFVRHPAGGGWSPPVRRAVVVGDTLYTLSELGVKASALATLADRAWLPFPAG